MRAQITERCFYQRSIPNQCRICIDNCPQQAIIKQNDALFFSAFACDECGQCVAVCPIGGIAGLMPERQRQGDTLYSNDYPPLMLKELLGYYADGVRHVIYRLSETAWRDCAESCNTLLSAMGKPLLSMTQGDHQTPERISHPLRTLFSGLDNKTEAKSYPQRISAKPLSQMFPQWQFYAPTIDTARCIACPLCSRSCPDSAIHLEDDGIWIDNGACSGCRLCETLCYEQAIHIRVQPAQRVIQIFATHSRICPACGDAFKEFDGTESSCPACQTRQRLNIPPHTIGQLSHNSSYPRQSFEVKS